MKKTKINIPVMFCFDTNYVIPAAAAFYSLLEHASKDYDYTFYVLHSDITEYQQEKLRETIKEFDNCVIEFIDMNHRLDDIWDKIYAGGHFSKEVMYKLLVASIFPNIDKLVVSDVDVIFLGDISDSYFQLTDEDDAYIAGVKPIGKIAEYLDNYAPQWTVSEISKLGNICGGYLIMNLKKIREDDFEKVFLKSLDDNGYRLNQMEQDILNITCYRKMKHLHLKYVACSYMWDYYKTDEDKETDINYSKKEIDEAMEHPVQLHYATGIKPWKNPDCTLSEIWYRYLFKTPFAQEFLNQMPDKVIISDKHLDELIQKREESKPEEIIVKESLYRRIVKKIPSPIKTVIKHPKVLFSKKVWQKISRKLFKKNYSYVIFDDSFPSDKSPFRYEEFIEYSKDNYNTYFALSGKSFNCLNEERKLEDLIAFFQEQDHHNYGRVFLMTDEERDNSLEQIKNLKNPIAIFTFLNNLISDSVNYLPFLEENNIPFIITLYPGGGLMINDEECDEKLKKVFSSKSFRKAIVTQDNVKKYLLDKKLCKEEDLELIFGVVIPKATIENAQKKRMYYPDKRNLDICFVANKYMKEGKDKGYDIFIDMAKKLVKDSKCKRARFHIVGNFNNKDIDVSDIEERVTFYGVLPSYDLTALFNRMDIIVSPTRPFVLTKNSFDGFPTGATTEAMFNGALGIVTDDLKLNNGRFVEGEEIIIVKPDADAIVKKIEELDKDKEKIKSIAIAGKEKTMQLYSTEYQIGRRIKTIKEAIKKDGGEHNE